MNDTNSVPPSKQALAEALSLSAEILRNVELSELPLSNIALKASRLARLLNDFDFQKIMEYEASGYLSTPDGISAEDWRLGGIAGRRYQETDPKTNTVKELMYRESISVMESVVLNAEAALSAAHDPNISSSNPNEFIGNKTSNQVERVVIRRELFEMSQKLASRRSLIYHYALSKHYELKFSGIADDIFTRIRERVDQKIGQLVPDAVQKFSAVYDNLLSENPEDWSNAVHSCRRILEELADVLFPATNEEQVKVIDGKTRQIKLGKEQYINRIIAFIEDKSNSERFTAIVGSELAYLGDRLDSIFEATQKGSHTTIVSKVEADRYVVYTYLLVGDILSLYETETKTS
jgi:AbiTii-like protein